MSKSSLPEIYSVGKLCNELEGVGAQFLNLQLQKRCDEKRLGKGKLYSAPDAIEEIYRCVASGEYGGCLPVVQKYRKTVSGFFVTSTLGENSCRVFYRGYVIVGVPSGQQYVVGLAQVFGKAMSLTFEKGLSIVPFTWSVEPTPFDVQVILQNGGTRALALYCRNGVMHTVSNNLIGSTDVIGKVIRGSVLSHVYTGSEIVGILRTITTIMNDLKIK